eukprot:3426318-Pyramimonas_sp.AAC.1
MKTTGHDLRGDDELPGRGGAPRQQDRHHLQRLAHGQRLQQRPRGPHRRERGAHPQAPLPQAARVGVSTQEVDRDEQYNRPGAIFTCVKYLSMCPPTTVGQLLWLLTLGVLGGADRGSLERTALANNTP